VVGQSCCFKQLVVVHQVALRFILKDPMTRPRTPGLWTHNKVWLASGEFARCHYSEQKLGGRRKVGSQHVCAREQRIPRRASRQRHCRGHHFMEFMRKRRAGSVRNVAPRPHRQQG
jgi:hypothetical protein